jgi:hypothetical protein
MGAKAEVLKEQIATARSVVDSTLGNVTQEACMKIPGGTAHSIGATLAHMLMSEDFVVNMMVRGATPIMMSTFAGKTGFSEPQPMPGSPADDVLAWANRVQIDLAALKEYQKAVYAATDEYLNAASDEELSRKIAFAGMGEQPVSNVLGLIVIVHPSNHIGEISALKGVFGETGYGF